jgi:CheY-like chemotaxis protein
MGVPGATLVIVDDEPIIRVTLVQVFAQLGYGVRTAKDGFGASP